ncbi:demethylmenaquinone methyltransferase [Deinococcus cellulosilyticus NBRC 106333 = KACC 11606]|uniref:Demethylmenaquinone methyltransferase n=2 Tax=Deinococcus cellulosilyticus TaxID=401558 RepID=A0A511N3N6_DEIC1|nr:demethylmenaquinone methyltransferase [Deinococcus cellulosilyticus NBRC 106333 = KACC 11606]
MFSSIAPRYDLLNRLMSLGVDQSWRKTATQLALQNRPASVLDVATGTADFALMLKKALPSVQVTGSDFVPAMLEVGRLKAKQQHIDITLEEGDALNLPYADNSFDALTCAFGFRNFANYERGLQEFHRVLKPGGRAVILEFPPPQPGFFGMLVRFYFRTVLPTLGSLVSGKKNAYTYLPESIMAFPEPEKLRRMMEEAGFSTSYQVLSFGLAAVHVGVKR